MLRKKFAAYLGSEGEGVRIDYLIFGCTHFPALEPLVKEILGPVQLVVELAARFGLKNGKGSTKLVVSGLEESEKLSLFQTAAREMFRSFLHLPWRAWRVVNFFERRRFASGGPDEFASSAVGESSHEGYP
ncbi:unnamed protein product [Durusdinium trenchii]|uniref:Glutamate racemase n=1 Tax=Durusdinium trenchii TaxID=1381693 RepID=A0ABP0L8S0_9DINO